MYQKIPVSDLSQNQMRNLVHGRGVRVKYSPSGQHHIMMSPEQMKRMARAHKQGKGITIMMDPYQQDNHKQIFGKGVFGKKFDNFMVKKLGQARKDQLYEGVNKFAKPLVKKGISKLAAMGQKLGLSPQAIGAFESVAQDYVDDPGRFQKRDFMSEFGKSAMRGATAPKEMAVGDGVGLRKRRTRRKKGGALFPAGRF